MKKKTIREVILSEQKTNGTIFLSEQEAESKISADQLRSQNKQTTYKGEKKYDYECIYLFPTTVCIEFTHSLSIKDFSFCLLQTHLRTRKEDSIKNATFKSCAGSDFFRYWKLIPGKEHALKHEDIPAAKIKKYFIEKDYKLSITSGGKRHGFSKIVNSFDEYIQTYEDVITFLKENKDENIS